MNESHFVVARAAVAERGFAILPSGVVAESAFADPWSIAQSLLGARPWMVERQPIRPVPGGRSFASTNGFTPLHTDSQDFLGDPPSLQLMFCKRAAEQGGETLLVDAWQVIETIEREDPPLFRALFETTRTIPFYFGKVVGPTVRKRDGRRVVTHSPMPPTDDVGRAFVSYLERAPTTVVPVAAGEVLIVDNHRMLHGRNAFADLRREFLRVLSWSPPASAERQMAIVLEMSTGVPPAKIAAREGLAESTLYEWRTRAFTAARAALTD